MTVEEMRKEIKNKCINTDCDECRLCPLYDNEGNCYEGLKSEEIKKNYELMFGKEESEMKNEFDFNELKAGMAIKIHKFKEDLLIGIPFNDDIVFYSKTFKSIVNKKQILNKEIYKGKELDEEYMPIEIYSLSNDSGNLFDASTRSLLWKKEDMNFKEYKFGDITITPNFKEGYICEYEDNEEIVYIEESREYMLYPDNITIKKSELDDVINALTEIRDFIKED